MNEEYKKLLIENFMNWLTNEYWSGNLRGWIQYNRQLLDQGEI